MRKDGVLTLEVPEESVQLWHDCMTDAQPAKQMAGRLELFLAFSQQGS